MLKPCSVTTTIKIDICDTIANITTFYNIDLKTQNLNEWYPNRNRVCMCVYEFYDQAECDENANYE